MKIGIRKIETFNITHTTQELVFEMDEFRNCTPAFIGDTHKDFMDYITSKVSVPIYNYYITNDIELIKSFINDNDDVLSNETKRRLYLLDVDPVYEVIEDSRNQYEDSWFTMNQNVEVKEQKLVTNTNSGEIVE